MRISNVADLFCSSFVPVSSLSESAYPAGMGSMFNQWVDGQPWWMTLLLLPAIVLGAIALKVVRYGLIAAAVAVVIMAATTWVLIRRRR